MRSLQEAAHRKNAAPICLTVLKRRESLVEGVDLGVNRD